MGDGNVIASADPIGIGPNDELFLAPQSECIDVGDSDAGTTDYDAIGLDWGAMTTLMSGDADALPIDAGAHYHP